jgi:hypothetical protein
LRVNNKQSLKEIIKKYDVTEDVMTMSRAMSATKLKAFKAEDEVRIIIRRLNYDDINQNCSEDCQYEQAKTNNLSLEFDSKSLKQIIFGERMPDSHRKIIEQLVNNRDIKKLQASATNLSELSNNNYITIADIEPC